MKKKIVWTDEMREGVLEMRKTMTLKAIGEIYGVSQERIRQVEAKAMRNRRKRERESMK